MFSQLSHRPCSGAPRPRQAILKLAQPAWTAVHSFGWGAALPHRRAKPPAAARCLLLRGFSFWAMATAGGADAGAQLLVGVDKNGVLSVPDQVFELLCGIQEPVVVVGVAGVTSHSATRSSCATCLHQLRNCAPQLREP